MRDRCFAAAVLVLCALAWCPLAADEPLEYEARPVIMTSDGAPSGGTHTTTPGLSVWGLDHDGVADLIITRSDGTFRCSGVLLSTGRHILTAAHGLTDSSGNLITSSVTAQFELPGPDVFSTTSTFDVHGSWDGNVTHGYDIAILTLSSPPAGAATYELYRDTATEVGSEFIKVGYGESGHGSTGATISSGTKRYGKNKWEGRGLGGPPFNIGGLTNNTTQLTYDFDDGTSGHDAFDFFFNTADLGLGVDEVNGAPGDSGGPSFIDDDGTLKIAGITSYALRLSFTSSGASSDVDGSINFSFGEFAVDARVADPAMLSFIDSVIPEPATLWLLAIGALGLLRRGR